MRSSVARRRPRASRLASRASAASRPPSGARSKRARMAVQSPWQLRSRRSSIAAARREGIARAACSPWPALCSARSRPTACDIMRCRCRLKRLSARLKPREQLASHTERSSVAVTSTTRSTSAADSRPCSARWDRQRSAIARRPHWMGSDISHTLISTMFCASRPMPCCEKLFLLRRRLGHTRLQSLPSMYSSGSTQSGSAMMSWQKGPGPLPSSRHRYLWSPCSSASPRRNVGQSSTSCRAIAGIFMWDSRRHAAAAPGVRHVCASVMVHMSSENSVAETQRASLAGPIATSLESEMRRSAARPGPSAASPVSASVPGSVDRMER
mmetsp:Transcript_25313/g.65705  ORF Transcript_25313/g.65705 Transcript_25313/m.65705 type:complete len:326 (-) Transcript_25313:574-1551(-)